MSYDYQWVSNDGTGDTDIAGATGSTYTLVDADEGKTIKVRISFMDDRGHAEVLSSAATSSVAARPNTAAGGVPTISGTVQAGETLTADTSGITDADGLTGVSYDYQWVSNDGTGDTDIAGATGSTYVLAAGDEGKTIKVRVSFTDDRGHAEALTSAATAAVAARPNTAASGVPTISGTARVDKILTADTSGITDADGLTGVTYGYQWVRVDGGSDADIAGATGPTYVLAAGDEGKTVKVRVSFTDDWGNAETLTSAETATVAVSENTSAGGVPTTSGTVQVGETLTADTSGITDTDGLTGVVYSYQWVRVDGGADADVAGATGSTYTLVPADEGKTVRVRVSFVDDAGNFEALTSAETVSVEPAAPLWTATLTTGWAYTEAGYVNIQGYRSGTLTSDSFEIDGVEYTVNLIEGWDWLHIGFDREISVGFTLEVDGTRLESSEAEFTSLSYSKIYRWEDVNVRWSEGDTARLRLYLAGG